MPDFNFLTNVGRQQAGGDIVDSLGRGFQLGRNIGMIPYQNALATEKMAEIERLKQARNAMSEYGTSGDIQPLMQVNPVAAFELQDKQATLQLKQAGISEKNIKLGVDAITKLAPMITEQNYPQVKATVDKLFGGNVMPDKFDPQAIARMAAFAQRSKGGLTNVPMGGAVLDPLGNVVYQNPLQARPMSPFEAGRLGQYQQGLDIQREGQKTIVPGEIDTETGLPKTPTETFTGKVKFRPGAGAGTSAAVPVMTESQAKAVGTVPKGTRIIKDNDPDYAAAWQQAVTLVASVVTQMSEEEKVASTQRIANDLYQRRKAGRPGATGTPAPIAPAGSVNIRPTNTPPAAMLREGAKRAVLNPSSGETEYWTLKNGQAVRVE